MRNLRTLFNGFGVCVLAAASLTGTASAQSPAFPSRTITIIVPYAAGATDRQARQLAELAARDLGQPIVVENRAGAGGTIGAALVAAAPADGHTLLYAAPAVVTVAPLVGKTPYAYEDLKPLARASITPHLLAARIDAPFKTVPEMVAYAKANPGKVTFGSPGNGTAVHLAGEALADAAGIKLNHVPFQGLAPAVTAAAGGFVDLVLGAPGPINTQIDGGRLRAIAQFGATRADALKTVATLTEGRVNLDLRADFGFFVPKGTPANAIARLEAALEKAIGSSEFRDFVVRDLTAPAFLPSSGYQEVVDNERAIYARIIPNLPLHTK